MRTRQRRRGRKKKNPNKCHWQQLAKKRQARAAKRSWGLDKHMRHHSHTHTQALSANRQWLLEEAAVYFALNIWMFLKRPVAKTKAAEMEVSLCPRTERSLTHAPLPDEWQAAIAIVTFCLNRYLNNWSSLLPSVLIFCSSLLLSLKHTHPSTSSHTHTKSTIQRKRAPTAGQTMVWSTTEDLGPKQTRKTPTPAKIEHLFKFRAPSVRVQHVRGCFWHQGGNYPDPTRVSSPPLPFKCSRVGVLK